MIVIFFRETDGAEFFYPIELPEDGYRSRTIKQMVEDSAALNPGTIRVEDIAGRVLWPVIH